MKTYKSSNTEVRQDVYSRVTAKIIADLEQGVRPWMKPWSGENAAERITLPLRHCGTPYRGINILLLWGEAMAKGYASNKWMTYKQAAELGAHVRKGEHGSLVVYADRFMKTEADESGKDVEREIPFMKGYTVFNVEQIEGLPERYYSRPQPKGEKMQLIEAAEAFFAATGATIRHGGNMAYYAPGPDVIQLPHPEAFTDAESYAATKAHELTHWTKHDTRLARDFGRKHFGDEGYAREDHSAYIEHWLKVLKDDRRAIFQAAAHAQRAVDYLHALQMKDAAAA
jgi:antirestriction protein ArdC